VPGPPKHVRRTDRLPQQTEQGGFTGRFQRGPHQAVIRLVVFGDYQCGACCEIHEAVVQLLSDRDDLSYSHKHLPRGCFTCNGKSKGSELIQTAGRAARVAETAGLLKGNDGFWAMHEWLFQRDGQFTDKELVAALPGLGFDGESAFFQTMNSAEVTQRVECDVEESISLAVFRTPAVFVNGVQLEGLDVEQALPKAVEAVTAIHPEPRSAAFDRPLPGAEGLFRLWRTETPVEVSNRRQESRVLGEAEAPIRIVVWADYQSPGMPDLSRLLRGFVAKLEGVSLEMRHFPLSKKWNPNFSHLEREVFPDTWKMTKVVEAAAELGGPAAFWEMHEWLCGHQESFTIDAAMAAAEEMGIDVRQFANAVDGEPVRSRIDADITAGIDAGIGLPPCVYVDGRNVPDPHNRELYRRIFAEVTRSNEADKRADAPTVEK
jgi:protein-disulfide isomerase